MMLIKDFKRSGEGPDDPPTLPILCAWCYEYKVWHYLWSDRGIMEWFALCDNTKCKYGPTLIREIKED